MSRLGGFPIAMPSGALVESSTQEFPLGQLAQDPNNGDVYKYVLAGATALVPGKLYDGAANITDHANMTTAAAAIGAVLVTVTPGATAGAANLYAGGYLVVNDVTGEGYTYKVKSHPAITASTAFVVTLEDSLIVALDATSQCTLVHNQAKGLIIHPATETGVPIGVAVYAITALYYGWVKKEGCVALLQDASTGGIGTSVAASTTTAGAGTLVVAGLKEIGTMASAGVSTEYNACYLSL